MRVVARKDNIDYVCWEPPYGPWHCGNCKRGVMGRPGAWRPSCRVCRALFIVEPEPTRPYITYWPGSIGAF